MICIKSGDYDGVTHSYHPFCVTASLFKTQVGHHSNSQLSDYRGQLKLPSNLTEHYPHFKTETSVYTGAHLLMPPAGKTENYFHLN